MSERQSGLALVVRDALQRAAQGMADHTACPIEMVTYFGALRRWVEIMLKDIPPDLEAYAESAEDQLERLLFEKHPGYMAELYDINDRSN